MYKTFATCVCFMQGWAWKCFAAATVGATEDQEITQQNTGFVQPAEIAKIMYICIYYVCINKVILVFCDKANILTNCITLKNTKHPNRWKLASKQIIWTEIAKVS